MTGHDSRVRRPARHWLRAAITLLLVVSAGFADLRATRSGGDLENSYRSPDALARAVLRHLENRNRKALESLLVSREEHRDLLWPQLPERQSYTFEYVRAITARHTGDALDQALSRYGGRSFELVDLTFDETERETYDDFTFHRKAELTVRHEASGREGELPILDVFVEWKGREWKLMDYEE